MNGVLCVNKPQNFTSFDVIAKLRGILKMKRLGHGGTLDPMATGVLPVFVGNATKAVDIMPVTLKSYMADFRLGFTSDTQDVWGNAEKVSDRAVSLDEIEAVLPQFRGKIMQIPPMYSAVQVNGQRLYDLARKGIEVERQPRETEIYTLRISRYDPDTREGALEIECSQGTYVRTIINDIGEKLGVGGIMTGLVRESSCGFVYNDCYTIEEIQKAADEGRAEDLILPIDRVFSSLPKLILGEAQSRMYRNGVKLDLERVRDILPDKDTYRVYAQDGTFFGTAVTDRENGILRVGKNLG